MAAERFIFASFVRLIWAAIASLIPDSNEDPESELGVDIVFDDLIAVKRLTRSELAPCSDTEIRLVESNSCLPLPRDYKRFLQLGGRGCGEVFSEPFLFFPQVCGLKRTLNSQYECNGCDFQFSETDCVFFARSNGAAWFMRLEEGGRPRVWLIDPSQASQPSVVYESFTAFLRDYAEQRTLVHNGEPEGAERAAIGLMQTAADERNLILFPRDGVRDGRSASRKCHS